MNTALAQNKESAIAGYCMAISLFVHALFLVFIQTHSLWFCSSVEKAKSGSSRLLERVSENEILQETFDSIAETKAPARTFTPEVAPISSSLIHIPMQQPAPHFSNIPLSSQDATVENLLSPLSEEIHFTRSIHTRQETTDFLEGLILPSIEPLPQVQLSSHKFSLEMAPMPQPLFKHMPPPSLQDILSPFPLAKKSLLLAEQSDPSAPQIPSSIPLPNLPQFFTLADLETINLSDAFNAELTFLSKPDDSGYLFALTLLPRADLHLPKLQQRLTFVIDRGNSIQRERLVATKQAVLRAIEDLEEDDSFNIVVFDSKTEKLFSSFAPVTASTISTAEEFLDKVGLGSFFSTSDPYRPLLLTIPNYVPENELYTTILLTNGETLSNPDARKALTRDWTLQNQGRVSLYVVGMETDPHGATFETLCALNRGRFIQSSSQRGLKRQVLKLTKNIKTPLAKDLSIKIISRTANHKIDIYPQPGLAPHLYLNQPYVLIGSTDTLDDFFVFVQGRLKNQWLNVKKPLSFVNAKKGNSSLKTAFQTYEKLDLNIR